MLSKILDIKNLTPIDKTSPLLYSKIESLYDNEEYDTVISIINAEFHENKYIDISYLIIMICSYLFKSKDLFADIDCLYKDLNVVLDKYSSSLSPVENYEKYVTKSFTRLNKVILYLLDKESGLSIEFEQLSTIMDNINTFNKNFKDIYKIDLTVQKSFISFYKIFSAEREVLKSKVIDSENLSQGNIINNSNEKLTSKSKDISKSRAESKYDIRNIASIDWFKLVEKLNMLKICMNDKGLLEQSIIYYDIQKELRMFDPKKYFPGLFFDVYASVGSKAHDIYKFIDKNKDTVEWHLTEQLYQFDKKRFLNMPITASNTQEHETQDFPMFEDKLAKINESNKTLINDLHYMKDGRGINSNTDTEQVELDSIIDNLDDFLE